MEIPLLYETYLESDDCDFLIRPFVNMNYPAHFHDSFELLFLKRGRMSITVNGVNHEAAKGDIAVLLPHDIHSYCTPAASEGVIVFFTNRFAPSLCEIFRKNTLKEHVVHLPGSRIGAFLAEANGPGDDIRKRLLCQSYLYGLFCRLLSVSELMEKRPDADGGLLKRTLLYVQREYDRGINLNETAEQMGVKGPAISKLFRTKIGCSFHEYIVRLRLEKAKSVLKKTDLPILDVAIECGFENQRSFNRTFQKFERTTPSQYRNTISR